MKYFASFFSLKRIATVSIVSYASYSIVYAQDNSDRINQSAQARKGALHWLLESLPQRGISQVWGSICHKELPIFLRSPLYSLWGLVFSSNLKESKYPLHTYLSLAEFFTRPLHKECRPISSEILISPVDAVLTVAGKVPPNHRVEQIKNVSYDLSCFLGHSPTLSCSSNSLYYCVLYLAPGDYHRIHSPTKWTLSEATHIAGNLYPVNPLVLRHVPDLFALNERVIFRGQWSKGYFSMSAVGALNVGSIQVKLDSSIQTNIPSRTHGHFSSHFDEYQLIKGTEMARFDLGSTVVLVFEASDQFEFVKNPGDRVEYGCALGRER